MSEQRLDQVRFSRKRPNAWSVDLKASSVYRPSGDRLIDQPAFTTSRKADTLEIRGGSIAQGGNLLLGRGNDTLRLQLESWSGENAWTLNTGEDDDRIELQQLQEDMADLIEAFSLELGDGNDSIITRGPIVLRGSNSRYSQINAGLGSDQLQLGHAHLEAVNLDTGPGKDLLILFEVENSNLSSADDADTITLLVNGRFSGSSLSCGAGEDRLELSGSIEDSAIDTGSGGDQIDAHEQLQRTEINTGDGDDDLFAAMLTDCSIQTGDGDDTITGHLSGINDITLNDGNDLFRLNGFTEEGSTINAGTGYDTLISDVSLLITDSNSALVPSYTETISDSGNFVFTYYGDSDAPLLTLIGFESISFANTSFGSVT